MKPETYPAEPINSEEQARKVLPLLIPKKSWDGDWLINLENDINWLAEHFTCGIGDYLYVRESHRFFMKDDRVHVEYKDLVKRQTPLRAEEVRFLDRWLPPVGMLKLASRFVLKVRDISVNWNDKKTDLFWFVGIERMGNPEALLLEL